MNFEIKETGQRLTDREIAAYEAGAKVRLPPQYRSFLKRINGFISLVMIGPGNGLDNYLSTLTQAAHDLANLTANNSDEAQRGWSK